MDTVSKQPRRHPESRSDRIAAARERLQSALVIFVAASRMEEIQTGGDIRSGGTGGIGALKGRDHD